MTGCVTVKRALLTSAHKKKLLDWCVVREKIGQLNNGRRCSGLMNQFELIPEKGVGKGGNERYHPDCINSTMKHRGEKLQVWVVWLLMGLEY